MNLLSTLLTLQIRDPDGKITRWPVQVLPNLVAVGCGWLAGVVVSTVPSNCPVAGDFFEASVGEGILVEGLYEVDDPLVGEWSSFDWRLWPTKLRTDGLYTYAADLDGSPKGLDADFFAVEEPWLIPPASPSDVPSSFSP